MWQSCSVGACDNSYFAFVFCVASSRTWCLENFRMSAPTLNIPCACASNMFVQVGPLKGQTIRIIFVSPSLFLALALRNLFPFFFLGISILLLRYFWPKHLQKTYSNIKHIFGIFIFHPSCYCDLTAKIAKIVKVQQIIKLWCLWYIAYFIYDFEFYIVCIYLFYHMISTFACTCILILHSCLIFYPLFFGFFANFNKKIELEVLKGFKYFFYCWFILN